MSDVSRDRGMIIYEISEGRRVRAQLVRTDQSVTGVPQFELIVWGASPLKLDVGSVRRLGAALVDAADAAEYWEGKQR